MFTEPSAETRLTSHPGHLFAYYLPGKSDIPCMVKFHTAALKQKFTRKWTFCWKCAHPQAVQDEDEFDSSSDLEKCSIASLAQQWMLCTEWVPSEWESKQLIKTSQ